MGKAAFVFGNPTHAHQTHTHSLDVTVRGVTLRGIRTFGQRTRKGWDEMYTSGGRIREQATTGFQNKLLNNQNWSSDRNNAERGVLSSRSVTMTKKTASPFPPLLLHRLWLRHFVCLHNFDTRAAGDLFHSAFLNTFCSKTYRIAQIPKWVSPV